MYCTYFNITDCSETIFARMRYVDYSSLGTALWAKFQMIDKIFLFLRKW